jgi:Ca-activated chloride channel family protein
MRIRLGRRRSSHTVLATLAVLGALGAMLFLRAPEPAAAVAPDPRPPATQATSPATTTSTASASQAELDGPGIDGALAFGEGAVRASGSEDVYAEIRLTGLAPEGSAPRAPVALAVVIDHSGSMMGEKMRQADEAVVSLLARMRDDDWVSVVIYDDEAEVLSPLAPVASVRERLSAEVRGVVADGGTNIPAGLSLGVASLAAAPADHVRRLVLLSDGLDGSGEPLASVEARVAAQARESVVTSALGIGIDYDERFMSGVAESGRGNYAFLEREEMLSPFLARELDQASGTVADAVDVDLTLPEGLRFVEAHGAAATASAGGLHVPIGSLFAGERRKVVLHFAAAPGSAGTAIETGARLSYRTMDHEVHTIGAIARVVRVETDAEVASLRDDVIWSDAYATVVGARQDQALELWRQGRREEAQRLTDANLAGLAHARTAAPAADDFLAAQIQATEAERSLYEQSAASAGGRAGGLAHRAARIQAAEAF